MLSFKITKDTNQKEFTLTEDSTINYNFIKANESLKGQNDTIADFNASVDGLEFTPEHYNSLGFNSQEEVQEYKESLKRGFVQDYNNYQKSSRAIEALEIDNIGLSQGNQAELKDALTLSLMQGLKVLLRKHYLLFLW